MSAQKIRKALGQLQDEPDNDEAWSELRDALGLDESGASKGKRPDPGMSDEELWKLLEAARRAHEMRREYDAVANLLAMEVALARGTEAEADLLEALARVLEEELLDDARATAAFTRLLELKPNDLDVEEALEKAEAKRSKWEVLVQRYVDEAGSAGEPAFKASLLVSAAETAYRYGRPEAEGSGKGSKKKLLALYEDIIGRLKSAIGIDPRNRRAVMLLERIYREQERWEDLAATLEAFGTEANIKEDKTAAFVRLARVLTRKLKSPERAAAAWERVIDLSPGHAEATNALVDFFTAREMWDHLVALYEEQLKGGGVRTGQEIGIVLQVAMVHWKMRGKPEAAEPYFDRLRKSEPAHPGMLEFFREWCKARAERARLAQILTDAQRSMPDGPERAKLAAEIAQLAEEGENAVKAIEQWRSLLRQDPGNKEARDALKRLYRQSGGWNSLADLLRQELERVAPDDKAARLPLLREIAALYREQIKSDSALVTVLSQIIQLDPNERDAVRELARVYESLGRWRDLLGTQMRLAELEPDADARAELYRAIARRWLDQFSNVQNALEAYEKLREAKPDDREAVDKLRELYAKRRAYKPMYDLLEAEAGRLPAGPERRAIWLEMAKLAAERLEQGAQAVKLYKKVLEEEPANTAALDALEKHAERDKDFITVAEVLERRADVASDDATRLTVLQKLGAIYSERLHDHQGAMRAWRQVLELQPGNVKALRVLRDAHLAINDFDGLSSLYATTGDWEGLVEVLSNAADKTHDTSLKIDLSFRVADIFKDKIGAPERAFRAYERVLGVQPDDERAARELVPIYEKEEKWQRLPALYESLLSHAQDVDAKLALYAKLVNVTGAKLHDRAASFGFARRAFELAPDRDGAVEALEEAARNANDMNGFVDELQARLKQKKVKKEEKRRLRAKLASVYANELGRIDDAIAAYKSLVEDDEEDEASVHALDRVLRQADRRDDLRWLFQLRVDRANEAQKVALHEEWALLEEEAFSAPDRAAKIYEKILELVPQHGAALRAMARLLKASGDAEGAARALERDRDQRQGSERVARELELARLYITSLKKPSEAMAAVKRALELAPNDAGAIQVLEELLPLADTRAQAAVMLDGIYGEIGSYKKQVDVIQVRAATAASKGDRLALYMRLAEVHEKLGEMSQAFEVLTKAASDSPAELAVWDKLAVVANRTQRSQQFVEALVQAVPPTGETGLPERVEMDLSERIATLYDEMLGQIDEARPYLERILARDPSNERAFHRLKQILTTREKWDELEQFYERAVKVTEDGPRRADFLAEVALISEEITGNIPKAIGYYERILEIEPTHEQAGRALEKLYASEQRFAALAKLLERRLENATGDEATALRLRLGTLHFRELGDAKTALGFLEEVLQADDANRDARELVEKCLEVPELRPRAASVLETVYAARGDNRNLVRVLDVRLESVRDEAERRELLRRVAELRDERLSDDPGALEAYAKLLPLSPGDSDARARFLEIGRRLSAHERVAEVLSRCAEAADAPQPRAEILRDLAKVYEDDLEDAARAERVHRQILELDPEDPSLALPAARSLARIYAASGKDNDLSQILKAQVKLEDDAQVRRDLLGKLGELSEKKLDDPRGAIAAWKQRLDDDPGDEAALEALDRLYERTQEWRQLVEVLRMRERVTQDGELRKSIMTRLASTLAERVRDVQEATLAYRALLDDFGADAAALAALAKLYEVADRWQDLAETIEAELSLIEVPQDKLALLVKLGTVRQQRLHDTPSAIEAYRQALSIDPSHTSSRHALEALLVDTEARREAASILRPLYEADADHTRLLRVIDIEAEHAETVDERLALFAQGVTISQDALKDPARAFAYAARGVREACEDAELPKWLERAEKLTETTGAWPDLVELLREVIPDIIDGDLQLEATLKVAELARTKLNDLDLAKSYYLKALDVRGDERRALLALESLYAELKDAPALLDILRRLAETAESDEERKATLFKQAKLCDETIADARKAIETYEEILEIDLDPQAIAALQRLYTSAGRFEDLVALYERELALDTTTDERKAVLHQKLGEVHERQMKDVERAFDEYEASLRLDPQQEETIRCLEGLMQDRAHAARAAEVLEGVYLALLDWRKVMTAISVRLEHSQDPDEKRQLLRRLAKLHEEQEENYRAALETTARLLAEDVTDEATWAELERLARVANAEARLAEIYATELEKVTSEEGATAKLARRTGELFEAQKNVERALVFYRRAYEFAPEEGQSTFEAIDRLLRETNRSADRVALYRGRLEHQDEPKDRVDTLHTIAKLQENDLQDDEAAIETHRQVLDIEDVDVESLDALTRLYARRSRWRDLADLHRKRAEQSALPEDEARYRLELGRVLQTRLQEVGPAIDEYQAAVELGPTPSHAAAVQALEGLLVETEFKARLVELLRPIYETSNDWRKMVTVNAERLAIAQDVGERVTILRDTAKLWEEQGKDLGKAFEAARDAFVLDPDDGQSRAEVDRLAELTKRWDDLAAAYETAIEKTSDVSQKELLGALARVHDRRRDDPRRALEAYDRLFRLDETDVQPLEEMDSLATLLSDWSTLVRVLAKKAELTPDDELRASTWRRIGEARRDMLEDAPGAIDAYERALELEPDSAFTIDSLIPLYEAKNDAARLVDLYRRRIGLCGEDDGELKFQLMLDAASRYDAGLGDRREAIALLNDALALKPNDPEVVRRLEALYTSERMWPELLETLRLQASAATTEADRSAARKRIGALLAKELDDPKQALDAYRSVLEAGYDDEAVRAVRELGESRDELRMDAASILEPVLRAAEKWEDLVGAYELRLRGLSEPAERSRTLTEVATVCEARLGDAGRALDALLRALGETPNEASLHDQIERVSGQLGDSGWRKYAEALGERAATIFDASVTSALFARLGKVAEEHLRDDVRAAKAYSQALEQSGDDPTTLAALDRLYGRLGEARALADVLERRIALQNEPAALAELYHRLGTLQVKEFGERPQGLASLRQSLEKVPSFAPAREALTALLDDEAAFDEAFEALDWAYRKGDEHEELAKLFERKVARAASPRDKVRARLELAKILEEKVGDGARAQASVEAAVVEDPLDADALAELERLAAGGRWSSAAAALDRALAGAKELPSGNLAELWGRLAAWRRDQLDDLAGAEHALEQARKFDPDSLDILRALERLRRNPGRERELVETLRARAKLEGSGEDRRALLREAENIAEEKLADRALAEAALRELLQENEADAWALEELTRLRELAGDFGEVVALLLRRAELAPRPEDGVPLRHRAARVLAEQMNDEARAIKLYEEILESVPDDRDAASGLRALYEKSGRTKDMAALLERQIERATSAAERSALRMDLAKLQDEKFDAPADAVKTLRALLEEDATHGDAVIMLSKLLERTGRDEELAELLDSQTKLASERGDVSAELALRVRLGELYEGKLKDAGRALATYLAVLEREPGHRGALEASARLAESREEWSRAASALSRLLEDTKGAEGVALALRLAAAREKLGDVSGVEDALKRALELDARDGDVRARLRALYEREKKWLELAGMLVGDAELIRAAHPAETEPAPPSSGGGDAKGTIPPPPAPRADMVKLLRRAAEIHMHERKEPGDAVPLLERAVGLLPHDRELLLLLCDAYTSAQRERDAAKVLEQVIASFGNKRTKELSLYHHRLAQAMRQLGDKDVALAQLDMAFKIDPGSVPVLKDLGVLSLEANDLDRAQKTFRALLLQKLDDKSGISKGEVFYYLGEISAKQGDKAKAVQMLERAIENEPSLDRARAMLQELKG
jgi:tetratricopeptide (TPR) repeat protein